MTDRTALVLTSIASETPALRALGAGAREHGTSCIIVGDEASPPTFHLEGCRFYGLDHQRQLDLRFAQLCPTRHYARKNIGYLIAMRDGATVILETDDDSYVYPAFWDRRVLETRAKTVRGAGWVNIYRYFSDETIWPRGLPLDEVRTQPPALETVPTSLTSCPIQQGLVDDDPDVDAIFRLIDGRPLRFAAGRDVVLGEGAWCPFNSQNTAWWREAYALMYLPAHCSFRMTDIWRSFVAQRIAWANGWGILFHRATLRQERNGHDLMRDFCDEIPGYVDNRALCDALGALPMRAGVENIPENMRVAYELLVANGWLPHEELDLLDAWLADVIDAVYAAASSASRSRWAGR